mgnify:CR=1 FL=1
MVAKGLTTPEEAIRIAFATAGRVSLGAALTSASAFACLAWTDFRAFREFGSLAAVGLLVAIPAVAAFNAFQRVVRTTLSNTEALSHVLLAHLKASGSGGTDVEGADQRQFMRARRRRFLRALGRSKMAAFRAEFLLTRLLRHASAI